jgi:hypothetical protein
MKLIAALICYITIVDAARKIDGSPTFTSLEPVATTADLDAADLTQSAKKPIQLTVYAVDRLPAVQDVGLPIWRTLLGLVFQKRDLISGKLGDWMDTDSELLQIRLEQALRHKQPLLSRQKMPPEFTKQKKPPEFHRDSRSKFDKSSHSVLNISSRSVFNRSRRSISYKSFALDILCYDILRYSSTRDATPRGVRRQPTPQRLQHSALGVPQPAVQNIATTRHPWPGEDMSTPSPVHSYTVPILPPPAYRWQLMHPTSAIDALSQRPGDHVDGLSPIPHR